MPQHESVRLGYANVYVIVGLVLEAFQLFYWVVRVMPDLPEWSVRGPGEGRGGRSC